MKAPGARHAFTGGAESAMKFHRFWCKESVVSIIGSLDQYISKSKGFARAGYEVPVVQMV